MEQDQENHQRAEDDQEDGEAENHEDSLMGRGKGYRLKLVELRYFGELLGIQAGAAY